MAAAVAPLHTTVLISGETGVGKELLARHIHAMSRAGKEGGKFVAVNCAAVPEDLFEGMFFGTAPGAFTGSRDTTGFFSQAHGGTMFLDEIADLSQRHQAKLLRVVEDGVYRALGAAENKISTARLLVSAIALPSDFREALLHRLAGFSIVLPPLRERDGDIDGLIEAFLGNDRDGLARPGLKLSDEARLAIHAYCWPGNIRELKGKLHRGAIVCGEREISSLDMDMPGSNPTQATASDYVGTRDAQWRARHQTIGAVEFPPFPSLLRPLPTLAELQQGMSKFLSLKMVNAVIPAGGSHLLEELTAQIFDAALERCDGSAQKACLLLGCGRQTVYRHIEIAREKERLSQSGQPPIRIGPLV